MTLIAELQRRGVLRTGAAYLVMAWLLIQVAETLFPLFGFDEKPARIVVIVLAIGFIPAMVAAWAFELTPSGIRREGDQSLEERRPARHRRLDRLIMLGLALGLAWFAFDRFVLAPDREASVAEQARQEGIAAARIESYGERSIAVLPFMDMSPQGDQEYLADGIAEELLNLLAEIPDLRVISRTSSFSFKGEAFEVPEIARRLGVSYVLEGSVRKAGNRIRITAQLIDARSDSHLWSQTFDRQLENVFAIQDEIAQTTLASLPSELLGEAVTRSLSATLTTDPRAYDLVLRGRKHNNLNSVEGYRQAQPLFEQAIDIDPDYAPAWGGLAKSLRMQVDTGSLSLEPTAPAIERALERALVLDPNNVDALGIKGKMLWRTDIETARRYWQRAIDANPSDVDAYRWLGASYIDDPMNALEALRAGLRVNPLSVFTRDSYLQMLLIVGDIDEALAVWAETFQKRAPGTRINFGFAVKIFSLKGEMDQAVRSFYHAYRLGEAQGHFDNYVSFLLNELGATALARIWIEEMAATPSQLQRPDWSGYFQESVLLLLEGEAHAALANLERGKKQGSVPDALLAFFSLRATRDFARARRLFETHYPALEAASTDLDLLIPDWHIYIDYALTLERTGDARRAELILATVGDHIRAQQQRGVVRTPHFWNLNLLNSWVKALQGDTRAAILVLEAAEREEVISADILRIFPHWDSLRQEPEFLALLARQQANQAEWRQRLEAAGLMLTPEQVLTSADDFSPLPALMDSG